MARRLLAFLAAALLTLGFVLGLARPAEASVAIESYRVTIRPGLEGAPAHFTLALDYRVHDEAKRGGFKYVGRSWPTGLRAAAPDGSALYSKVSLEESSGEHKLEFGLPIADTTGVQSVVVEFDQDLDKHYAWAGTVADVPWADVFGVPVGATTVQVVGPQANQGADYTCTGEGEGRVCERTGSSPFAVRVPTGPASRTWIVVWIGLSVVIALGLVAVIRGRHQTLLTTRGVLPPSTEAAYPDAPTSYRAPPSLPEPDAAEAVLSDDDRTGLILKVLMTFSVLILAQFVIARFLLLPFEVGVVLIATELAMAIPFVVWISSDGGGLWLAAAVLPTLALIVAVGFHVHPIFVVMGALFTTWLGHIVSKGRRGELGSGTSTSMSSSSCGGGGGGCGGGGGGGGCGG